MGSRPVPTAVGGLGSSAVRVRSRVAVAGWGVMLSGCGLFARSAAPTAAAAPRTTAGELDPRTLLADVPLRASRLGAGPPSVVASTEAVENEWIGGFVEVPQEQCILGYGRGSSSVEDVDIAIYSEDGTELAVDEARDPHPTVLLCPPHPDRVYVAAHVVEGEGFVVIAAQLVPRERALVVGHALGAHGAVGDEPGTADAWPGLAGAVRVHRAALGGVWEEFKRLSLPVDTRVATYLPLPIEVDSCVDAVIVADDEVAFLDVEAMDAENRVIAQSHAQRGARTLTVCSPLSMTGTLSVRPHVGRGRVAIVLARARGEAARDLSSRPEVAWVPTAQSVDGARAARNALLAKAGYGAPAASTSGSLTLGRRSTTPLQLTGPAGACSRIDVVAGAPLAMLDASIWDDRGDLGASDDGSSSVTLFACAHGSFRLELEARGRGGPFAITVRPERWKDPAFALHPLAASRMLARVAVGPDMVFAHKKLVVREQPLDAERLASWLESIDKGQCAHVTLGAQGEGMGIELRAFDGVDGAEIDRCEAPHAASVRACAKPDSGRTVRFEARASAGRLEAVVGTDLGP
jgi:hypothetical protein